MADTTRPPTHRELKINALEWSFVPAVLREQFRVFRFARCPGSDKLDAAAFAKLGLTKERDFHTGAYARSPVT